MITTLNKNLKKFLANSIEDITADNIKKYFNKRDKNDYGGLLHAAVQNKFDEEKVLKFIEVALTAGYDVNYSGEMTGYSFIHLALYGYTNVGKDYSYSTEFIVKLIIIAKNYGFNVNIKDNDGDSLIHTAIASETYTGKIIPILEALGNEFDINCVDNNNHNILEAYTLYLEYAKYYKKTIWFNRLSSEYSELKTLLEKLTPINNPKLDLLDSQKSLSVNKPELEENINTVRDELDNILKNITYEELINKKQKILSLRDKLYFYEGNSRQSSSEKISTSLWDKFQLIISKIVISKIQTLEKTFDIKYLEMQKENLKDFHIEGIDDSIDKIIINYRTKVQTIAEEINNELTLANVSTIISKFDDVSSEDKEELNKMLKKVVSQIHQIVERINKLSSILNISSENYDNFTVNQLNEIEGKLRGNVLALQREKIESAIEMLLAVKKEILSLNDGELFTLTELQALIDDSCNGLHEKIVTNKNNATLTKKKKESVSAL